MSSIIKDLRVWLNGCAILQLLSGGVKVDFTSEKTEDVGISPEGESIVKQYIDGSAVRQYSFTLYARKYTSADMDRLKNAEFLEQFEVWLHSKAQAGELPDIGVEREALQVSCSFASMLSTDPSGKMGLYQLPCLLTYRTKG